MAASWCGFPLINSINRESVSDMADDANVTRDYLKKDMQLYKRYIW